MYFARDVISTIVTVSIGTAVITFIQKTEDVWLGLVLTSLTFILIILLVTSKNYIILMLKRTGNWKIAGKWNSKWTYETEEGTVSIEDEIRLHQIGAFVYGKGRSTRVTGPIKFDQFNYTLRANMNSEGVLEGKFENRDKRRNYYGMFQLRCTRDGRELGGGWVGISTRGYHTGQWHWHANGASDLTGT